MATHAYDFSTEIPALKRMNREHLSEHLENLENFLFDPVARRDTSAVSSLLADEFREFGSSGRVYTKLDIVAELATEQPVVITLTDFACQLIAPTIALVTYKSLSSHENRAPTQALRSSVWALRSLPRHFTHTADDEAAWQMVFHQGTRF